MQNDQSNSFFCSSHELSRSQWIRELRRRGLLRAFKQFGKPTYYRLSIRSIQKLLRSRAQRLDIPGSS